MRAYICTKDVQVITGKSANTARKLIKVAKAGLGKSENKPLTIKEFCEFEMINFPEVNKILKNTI